MSKKTELRSFYENYENLIKNIDKSNEFPSKFYESFLSGKTELYQKYVKETKNFDEDWVKTVESYIPSLSKIVANPKETLKLVEEVVQIERAKKVDSNSIKHLSSNTHFIREVKSDGMVVPKKILTSYADVDYGTYENRFIMTLIDRLFIFVRNRYGLIKNNIESFENRHLFIDSDFKINETDAKIKFDLILKDKVDNKEINEYNKKLLERVEYLNKMVTSLKSSEFMTLMEGKRKILPPIMKTNIITKNVDYRNAYLLWLFLDRYNTLAFSVELEEKDLTFSDKYKDDLFRELLLVYSTIIMNQENSKKEYEEIIPKKHKRNSIKVITKHPEEVEVTLEDEQIEDNSLNEYYLNQNKKLFEQSLEYHEQTSATYETSLKRALRETLDISNALYESFFQLDEEKDVFRKLITEVDVTKELSDARRKALIARMIREVKEVDYNNALRREREQLKDIAKFDGVLLKEMQANVELGKRNIDKEVKLEEERRKALADEEIVKNKLEENKRLKEEINKFREETNKEIDALKRELEKREKNELRTYSKEQNKLLNDNIKKYLEDNLIKPAYTDKLIKEEIKVLSEKNELTKKRLETDSFNKVNNLKNDLEKRNQVILTNEKKRLEDAFEYQKLVNIQIEKTRKSLEQEIREYELSLNVRESALIKANKIDLDRKLKLELEGIKVTDSPEVTKAKENIKMELESRIRFLQKEIAKL